jgi:hypothetical protein
MPTGTTAKPLISSFVPFGIVVSTALETPMFCAKFPAYEACPVILHRSLAEHCRAGGDWSILARAMSAPGCENGPR